MSIFRINPNDVNRSNKVPVKPNAFGLYDMHGNVAEWVEDCFKGDCMWHMFRGGSWSFKPELVRAGISKSLGRKFRYPGLGFRVARVLL